MSQDQSVYTLPTVLKSPLNPYQYKAILLKNKLRVLLISIKDEPEHATGAVVEDGTILEEVAKFNKDFEDNPANNIPHKLSTGKDIYNESVQTRPQQCSTARAPPPKNKCKRPAGKNPSEEDFSGAMCLVIGVGDVSDPNKIYGMAHWCEHVSFLGSKDFPKASDIFTFMANNGGKVNASTGFFTTDYFLNIKGRDAYLEALDRMSDCLANAKLNPMECIQEIEAIDCEFSMRQRRSTIGLLQIIRSCTHREHPMHRLGCGNRKTIHHRHLMEKLLEFRKRYYVANLMTLTLIATMSLDDLEAAAIKYFTRIEEGLPCEQPAPWVFIRNNNPVCDVRFQNLFKVYSHKHHNNLLINFALEPNLWKAIGTRPLKYISYLLLDRRVNGLRNYLNRHGLSVDFFAGPLEREFCYTEFFSLFSILIILSKKGLEEYVHVLEATFAFIRMLKEAGPQKFFFDEMQEQLQYKFHYDYKTNHLYARRLLVRAMRNSHAMQGVPPWKVLSTSFLLAQYDPDLINKCLHSMTPENANIMITAQEFGCIANKVEPFYKHAYSHEAFSLKLLKKLSKSDIQFVMPEPNPYLNLTVSEVVNFEAPPEVTEIDEKATVLCLDVTEPRKGRVAKVKCAIFVQSHMSRVWEPSYLTQILDLMAYHLEYEINTKHKPASGSPVKINVGSRGDHLAIYIHCPAQFIEETVADVLKTFFVYDTNISEFAFEAKKERIIGLLMDTILDDMEFAELIQNYIFNNAYDCIPTMENRMQDLRFPLFLKKLKDFREKIHLTLIIEGCANNTQVMGIVETIRNTEYGVMNLKSASRFDTIDKRATKLAKGERCIRVLSRLSTSETSYIRNFYQFDESVDPSCVEKLASALTNIIFHQIRTIEQLGYTVKARFFAVGGVPVLFAEAITRAKYYTPEYIREQFTKFMNSFYKENVSTQEKFREFCSRAFQHDPQAAPTWDFTKMAFELYILPCGERYSCLSVQICSPGKISPSKVRDCRNKDRLLGTIPFNTFSVGLGEITLLTTRTPDDKYFVLNLDDYKNDLGYFPQLESEEDENEKLTSPFDGAEGDTSEEEND